MKGSRDFEFSNIEGDWPSIPLGRAEDPLLLIMRNGITVDQYKDRGDLRVTRIETISDGYIAENRVRYASGLKADQVQRFRIREGDVLFSHINSDPHLGKTAVALKDYDDLLHGMNLLLLRVNPKVLDARFLHFVCCFYRTTGRFVKIASRSVNQSSINQARLKALEIPLPPLIEQRKIGNVLGLVWRAVEQNERLIALISELKKTLLHHLFTEGLRCEPQKQTEIGPLPESWEVAELGGLATKVSKGSSPRWQGFEYIENGILFVRSQNVGPGRMDFSDRVFLSPKFNEHEKRSVLKDEDILINLVGASIGRVALGTQEIEGANCNQAVGFVRMECEPVFKEFIVSYLLSPMGQRQIFSQQKDIARANLSLLDVRSLKIPSPSADEVGEIASVFRLLEAKIASCERRRYLLKEIFRALLHQLMTAQIRLHNLNLPELESNERELLS